MKNNKPELKDKLKKLSAEIGRLEIMRGSGVFVPITVIDAKKREFRKLQFQYKQLCLALF